MKIGEIFTVSGGFPKGVQKVPFSDYESLICIPEGNVYRITRNEFDHFYIRRELEKHGTKLIAINQPIINNSPEGLLLDGMLASINAFYSRLTDKKVKKS